MSRPEQVLLVLVVFGVGVTSAVARGASATPRQILWSALALLIVAVSVHIINEFADYDTDALTRRTAFSGGSGALHDLGLQRSFARRTALGAVATALMVAALGLATGGISATAAVLLGVGLVGGWQYSVRPLELSRHGAGEVVNAVLGGAVLPLYGVAVASGTLTLDDALLFAPFALVVFVNLLETQWSDRAADAAAGKRTLVTRLSPRAVRVLAATATAAAYTALVVLLPDPMPLAVALASLSALPLSLWALARLTREDRPLPAVAAMILFVVAQGAAWLAVAPG